MKLIKRLLLGLIPILLIGYFGFAWMLSGLILFPDSSLERTKGRIETQWGTTLEAMLAPLPAPEDFQVITNDSLSLTGKYFQMSDTSQCAIILAHGWTSTWAGMLKYVPVLEDCQCDLVLYDHRVHGQSDGTYATGGIKEAQDLWTLTNWVQKEKGFRSQQIGWLGASWGGATVLTAGADERNVAFIIADAPFQDWYSAIFERAIRDYGSWIGWMSPVVMGIVDWRAGVDHERASAVQATPAITEPVLLIHSQMDSQTASQQSVNIAKGLNPKSTFHHLDWGGDHTQDVRINKERFQQLITDFIGKVDVRFLKGNSW